MLWSGQVRKRHLNGGWKKRTCLLAKSRTRKEQAYGLILLTQKEEGVLPSVLEISWILSISALQEFPIGGLVTLHNYTAQLFEWLFSLSSFWWEYLRKREMGSYSSDLKENHPLGGHFLYITSLRIDSPEPSAIPWGSASQTSFCSHQLFVCSYQVKMLSLWRLLNSCQTGVLDKPPPWSHGLSLYLGVFGRHHSVVNLHIHELTFEYFMCTKAWVKYIFC